MKKMTYIEALNIAIENLDNAEAVERLTALRDATLKRNSAERKPTKTQTENAAIRGEIVEFLADNAPTGYTCSDLIKSLPTLHEKSTQYVSAIMRLAVLADEVEKYTDKRKTYFRAK